MDCRKGDARLTWLLHAPQDKLLQKQHFQSHSIPLAEFRSVSDAVELRATGEEFGFPFMLKSRRRGSRGRHGVALHAAQLDAQSLSCQRTACPMVQGGCGFRVLSRGCTRGLTT